MPYRKPTDSTLRSGKGAGRPSGAARRPHQENATYKKDTGRPGNSSGKGRYGAPSSADKRGVRTGGGQRPHAQPDRRQPMPSFPAQQAQPGALSPMAEPPENVLYGRNPVREALKSGRSVERLLVASGLKNEGSVREIVGIAVENHVPVIEVPRERLDLLCAGAHHQGVALYAAMKDYVPMEDILAVAAERGEDAFVLVLDGIEDPQNVGAMLRVAECAGVHGVIVQKRRAAGLTPATMRAASGAGEYIPVCQVTNLRAALESLKQAGLWVMGADMDGECCYDASLTGPIALVIGAEGNGLSALTARTCDKLIRLPMRGRVGSLNASAAASALVYEIVRQRGWR